MLRPSSCLLSVRNHRINYMLALALCVLMISEVGFAQAPPPPEKIKKDTALLQNAVNEVINFAIPGFGVLQKARGAYLDGYGVVVTAEIALDSPRSPFDGQRSPDEIRKTATQRQKEVLDKLSNLLKEKVPTLESLEPAESVAIIVNLLNTNPADMPDMPSQIILFAKKQDAAAGRINIRDYK